MASAASSVMDFPFSRLWIVIRDTPSRAATCDGVPMASLIALYSLAVISGFFLGGDVFVELRNGHTPCVEVVDGHAAGLVVTGHTACVGDGAAGDELGIREVAKDGILIEGGKGFADGFDGGHGLGWFGVDRSQWRRGERKIDLRATQELSVKFFYAPFHPANAKTQAPT